MRLDPMSAGGMNRTAAVDVAPVAQGLGIAVGAGEHRFGSKDLAAFLQRLLTLEEQSRAGADDNRLLDLEAMGCGN